MDEQVPPDVLAATGASVAVLLAKIPFNGPMAAVRVGLVGDDFVINPTYREVETGDLDLVVAGSPDGVIMVEAGANQLPESDMIEAIDFGYEAVQDLIQAQLDLIKELGIELVKEVEPEADPTLATFIEAKTTAAIKEVLKQFDLTKPARDEKLDGIKAELVNTIAELAEDDPVRLAVADNGKALGNTYKDVTKKLMRQQILEEGVRVDGRKLDEVRPIYCQVGLLPPRVHGTGLFQRGLTQVMSVVTLGTPGDAQMMDDLHPEEEKRYLHHYNFPPTLWGRPDRCDRRVVEKLAMALWQSAPWFPFCPLRKSSPT
jgi:polyribonucleotide nucleotidyltransferase